MEKYYDNIIIPIDFGERTEIIVQQAYSLANLMNTGLTLVHVNNQKQSVSYSDNKTAIEYSDNIEAISTKLRRLAGMFSNKLNIPIECVVLDGEVHEAIAKFVHDNMIRLIVMGKSGKTQGQINNIGKYTAQIIRMSTCPVITINNSFKESISKILLPLDMSKQIKYKINIAIMFSRYYSATVKLISIINNENFNREREFINKLESTKNFLIENNVACTIETIYNFDKNMKTAERILKYANDTKCDIIMIMTQQEKNWKHTFIGSTASQIIKDSNVPVMSITPYQDNFSRM